jgi:hypothetical protein
MGAEGEPVAGFGRMEYGFQQAGDWYRWGPCVSERQVGHGAGVLQLQRGGVGLPAARSGPVGTEMAQAERREGVH